MERSYSTSEATRIAGITERKLQWWYGKRLVRFHKNGNGFRYSKVEVALAAVIAELRSKGMELREIRKLVPSIRSAVEGCWVAGDKIVYAVLGARTIGFHLSAETAIDKALQEKCVRVVDVGAIIHKIAQT